MPTNDVLELLGLDKPKAKAKSTKAKAKKAEDKNKTATVREASALPRNALGQFVSPRSVGESGDPTNPDSTDRPKPETFGESWASLQAAGDGQLNGGRFGGKAAEVLANLGFGMVPGVGLVNTVSGLLGGPTVGAALRGLVDPAPAPVASSTRAQIGNAPVAAPAAKAGTPANIPASPVINSPAPVSAASFQQQSPTNVNPTPAPPEARNVALSPAQPVTPAAASAYAPTVLEDMSGLPPAAPIMGDEPVYPDMSTAVFGHMPFDQPNLAGMAGAVENEIERDFGYPNGPRGPMATFAPTPPERPIGLAPQLAAPVTPAAYTEPAPASVQNPTGLPAEVPAGVPTGVPTGLETARAISAAEFGDRYWGERPSLTPEQLSAGMPAAPVQTPALEGLQSVDQSGISARHQGEFGGKQFTGEAPIAAMPQETPHGWAVDPDRMNPFADDAVPHGWGVDPDRYASYDAVPAPTSARIDPDRYDPYAGHPAPPQRPEIDATATGSMPSAPMPSSSRQSVPSTIGPRDMVLGREDIDRMSRLVAEEVENLAQREAVTRGIPIDEARALVGTHVADTFTNRAAVGQERWGKNVIDVMERKSQFSPVNGPITTKDLPKSPSWHSMVETYMAERAQGRKADFPQATHYSNPSQSDRQSKGWRDVVARNPHGEFGWGEVHHQIGNADKVKVPDYGIHLDYITPDVQAEWDRTLNQNPTSWASPEGFGITSIGQNSYDVGWSGASLANDIDWAGQGLSEAERDPYSDYGGWDTPSEMSGRGTQEAQESYFDGGSGYDTPSESTGRGTSSSSNTESYSWGGNGYDTPSEGSGRGTSSGSSNAGQDAVDAARAEAAAAEAEGRDAYSSEGYY
jgi:hypothetical protein